MKKETLILILRWIAVLPAAVLGALVGNLIGLATGNGYSWYTGRGVDGITEVILIIVTNALVGVGFVAAGWFTAPKCKKVVKIILATIVGCVCAFSIFLTEAVNKTGGDWIFYLSVVATIGGAVGICGQLEDEE